MNKKMMAVTAMALGMLSGGSVSAWAANSCCDGSKCADRQAVQQFQRETAETSGALQVKELELRELYGYDGIDSNRMTELQSEITGLKGQIRVIAKRYGVTSCCLG